MLLWGSCGEDGRARNARVVKQWMGKTLLFPPEGGWQVGTKPYTLLVYTREPDCTGCRFQAVSWKRLIRERDSLFPGELDFLFVFSPRKEKELSVMLERERFPLPAYFDWQERLYQLNRFPASATYHCFLLDSLSRVCGIGNPLRHPGLWNYYTELITGQKYAGVPETSATLSRRHISGPTVSAGGFWQDSVYLKNTGALPLLVKEVVSSCGCIVPRVDKRPVMPGDSLSLVFTVYPEKPGRFRKRLDIYCNATGSPLQLTLSGTAIRETGRERSGYPEGVVQSLRLAGKNRKQWEKVLHHYRQDPSDSLKYRAACFLIDQMKWHVSRIGGEVVADLQGLTGAFLTRHIDHAFARWQQSTYAGGLSFEQFLEYLLPYRALPDYPVYDSGDRIAPFFNTLADPVSGGLQELINRYFSIRETLRQQGRVPDPTASPALHELIGLPDNTCIPGSNAACLAFRACGIPAVVEYNHAYRSGIGCHYYGARLDTAGRWERFDPYYGYREGELPLQLPSMNLFRSTFSAQSDSPWFLRHPEEELPAGFSTPCIREVTASLYEVGSVTLPIDPGDIPNRLAYLYAFSPSGSGWVPATWGIIDRRVGEVTFDRVLYDALYFPVYIKGGVSLPFGEPFYLSRDSAGNAGVYHYHRPAAQKERGDLLLHRKYPVKPSLNSIRAALAGTGVQGANRPDFSDAVTLLRIGEAPAPWWQEYPVTTPDSFRYFRICLPASPSVKGAIYGLELLVDAREADPAFLPATDLPVFQPGENHVATSVPEYRKLHETDTSGYSGKRALPWPYRGTLKLLCPVSLQAIRLLPIHAGNGVVAGDLYELMYWDNGWRSAGTRKARHHYLLYRDVPLHTLYWLRNLSSGNEEQPFTWSAGQQHFIYASDFQ